jgi:hypothetical protein
MIPALPGIAQMINILPPGSTISTIIVRFQKPGFHNWGGATGERAYLADRHRHLFKVEAQITVEHDDREVEFHDFLDYCSKHFPEGEHGSRSCEMLCNNLIKKITERYPHRPVTVSVFEDGEVGALVQYTPPIKLSSLRTYVSSES